MTVNPYTMNALYNQGIIDYIPTDLMAPMPVGNMSMQNPYLNAAMQGNLYQQHGNMTDSFTSSNSFNNFNNQGIGFQSNITQSRFGNDGITGSQSSNGIKSMFGFGNGIGNQSQGTVSMFGAQGIGGQSNINLQNTYGGFGDVQNNISQGVNQAASAYSSTPNFVKGLIAGGLVVLTLFGMFRGGKKPAKSNKSFWSKLNPVNWFKKQTPPPPPPKKVTTWDKIKNWFKGK